MPSWLSSALPLVFLQKEKLEEAIKALKFMSSPAARVIRDGHMAELTQLVPGDIVAQKQVTSYQRRLRFAKLIRKNRRSSCR